VGHLLLVEDDHDIAASLTAALQRDGHSTERVATGTGALKRADGGGIDLIVLDLGLPDLDGLEVCRELRRMGSVVPIIVLTGRQEEIDLVVGLDAGADDYMAKPFRLAELQARVRALLRRGHRRTADIRGVRLDEAARRVWVDDTEVELSPKEFDLLSLLMHNAGTVVSREDIMSRVWDANYFGSTKTLDMHMSSLRRKLGDDPVRPRYVTTVRGVGFRFDC
jgi:DNA-binding response OmpR family regulator